MARMKKRVKNVIEHSTDKVMEFGAKNSPVKDILWNASQVQTPETRIEDAGSGRPIILRQFDFKYDPTLKGRPTKEQILTEDYKRYLNTLLWADELELVQEPKVVFEDKGFKVFAVCQARKGSMLPHYANKPLPLQEVLAHEYTKHN